MFTLFAEWLKNILGVEYGPRELLERHKLLEVIYDVLKYYNAINTIKLEREIQKTDLTDKWYSLRKLLKKLQIKLTRRSVKGILYNNSERMLILLKDLYTLLADKCNDHFKYIFNTYVKTTCLKNPRFEVYKTPIAKKCSDQHLMKIGCRLRNNQNDLNMYRKLMCFIDKKRMYYTQNILTANEENLEDVVTSSSDSAEICYTQKNWSSRERLMQYQTTFDSRVNAYQERSYDELWCLYQNALAYSTESICSWKSFLKLKKQIIKRTKVIRRVFHMTESLILQNVLLKMGKHINDKLRKSIEEKVNFKADLELEVDREFNRAKLLGITEKQAMDQMEALNELHRQRRRIRDKIRALKFSELDYVKKFRKRLIFLHEWATYFFRLRRLYLHREAETVAAQVIDDCVDITMHFEMEKEIFDKQDFPHELLRDWEIQQVYDSKLYELNEELQIAPKDDLPIPLYSIIPNIGLIEPVFDEMELNILGNAYMDDYLNRKHDWTLAEIPKERELFHLGKVIHQVLSIKYPRENKSPEMIETPFVRIRAILLCEVEHDKCIDDEFTRALKTLLRHRKIHVVKPDEVIQYCIDCYENERQNGLERVEDFPDDGICEVDIRALPDDVRSMVSGKDQINDGILSTLSSLQTGNPQKYARLRKDSLTGKRSSISRKRSVSRKRSSKIGRKASLAKRRSSISKRRSSISRRRSSTGRKSSILRRSRSRSSRRSVSAQLSADGGSSIILTSIPKIIQTPTEIIPVVKFTELALIGREAKNLFETNMENHHYKLPADLVARAIGNYINTLWINEGFVLMNFPKTTEEVRAIEKVFTGYEPNFITPGFWLTGTEPFRRFTSKESELVQNSFNYLAPFPSHFTAYIRLIDRSPKMNGLHFHEIDPYDRTAVDDFYKRLNVYNEFDYNVINTNLLKYLARILCGNLTLPRTESTGLFGVDVPCTEHKLSSIEYAAGLQADLKQWEVDTMNLRMVFPPEQFKESPKYRNPDVRSIGVEAYLEYNVCCAEHRLYDLPRSLPSDIGSAPIEMSDKIKWLNERPYLYHNRLGNEICDDWDTFESNYMRALKMVLNDRRIKWNGLQTFGHYMVTYINKLINATNADYKLVEKMQHIINTFDEVLRVDIDGRRYLHFMAYRTGRKLIRWSNNRKKKATAERINFLAHPYITSALSLITNAHIALLQQEQKRYSATINLLKAYYSNIAEQFDFTIGQFPSFIPEYVVYESDGIEPPIFLRDYPDMPTRPKTKELHTDACFEQEEDDEEHVSVCLPTHKTTMRRYEADVKRTLAMINEIDSPTTFEESLAMQKSKLDDNVKNYNDAILAEIIELTAAVPDENENDEISRRSLGSRRSLRGSPSGMRRRSKSKSAMRRRSRSKSTMRRASRSKSGMRRRSKSRSSMRRGSSSSLDGGSSKKLGKRSSSKMSRRSSTRFGKRRSSRLSRRKSKSSRGSLSRRSSIARRKSILVRQKSLISKRRSMATYGRAIGYDSDEEPEEPPQKYWLPQEYLEMLKHEAMNAFEEEAERAKIRIELIKQHAKNDIDYVIRKFRDLSSHFKERIDRIHALEMDSIERMMYMFHTAIEAGEKIQPRMIYSSGAFKADMNDPQFPTEPLEEPEPPLPKLFTIEQLRQLMNNLNQVAASGFCPERLLAFYIMNGSELTEVDREELVPRPWYNLNIEQLNTALLELYTHVPLLDWRDFILINLPIRFPTLEELENQKSVMMGIKIYPNGKLSKEQFMKCKYWFFNECLSDQDTKDILELLFDLFKDPKENQIKIIDFLIAFCKDEEPINGFNKALNMLKNGSMPINMNSEDGETYMKLLMLLRQHMQDTDRIINDLLTEILGEVVAHFICTCPDDFEEEYYGEMSFNESTDRGPLETIEEEDEVSLAVVVKPREFTTEEEKETHVKAEVEKYLELHGIFDCGCPVPLPEVDIWCYKHLYFPPFNEREFWLDSDLVGMALFCAHPWYNLVSGEKWNLVDGIAQVFKELTAEMELKNEFIIKTCQVPAHRLYNNWFIRRWVNRGLKFKYADFGKFMENLLNKI